MSYTYIAIPLAPIAPLTSILPGFSALMTLIFLMV
jgi:hypothetical protein